MNGDLFATEPGGAETLADGVVLLRAYAAAQAPQLLADIDDIAGRAPFRHLDTPGGYRMSVAMTSCGSYGWVSDRRGYRYVRNDPQGGAERPGRPCPTPGAHWRAARRSWPALPPLRPMFA